MVLTFENLEMIRTDGFSVCLAGEPGAGSWRPVHLIDFCGSPLSEQTLCSVPLWLVTEAHNLWQWFSLPLLRHAEGQRAQCDPVGPGGPAPVAPQSSCLTLLPPRLR